MQGDPSPSKRGEQEVEERSTSRRSSRISMPPTSRLRRPKYLQVRVRVRVRNRVRVRDRVGVRDRFARTPPTSRLRRPKYLQAHVPEANLENGAAEGGEWRELLSAHCSQALRRIQMDTVTRLSINRWVWVRFRVRARTGARVRIYLYFLVWSYACSVARIAPPPPPMTRTSACCNPPAGGKCPAPLRPRTPKSTQKCPPPRPPCGSSSSSPSWTRRPRPTRSILYSHDGPIRHRKR
eukprot:808610-Prorocentrum_minimum.AAC.2